MEAIEVITSKTKLVVIPDKDGKSIELEIPVWNATIANLTLMALGSSAPEILLSVVGVVTALGEPADELGPSSIVGSAAFNLLVISAVSILSIGDEVKKIYDMGVFFTTMSFSLFAYVWLFICLEDNEVSPTEAWLTLVFFVILVVLAFAADKFNESRMKKIDEVEDQEKAEQ